jgi:hypothetical protein
MANVRVQLDDGGFKHPPAGSVFDFAVFGNRRRRKIAMMIKTARISTRVNPRWS